MVTTPIWRSAGYAGYHGLLHLTCLESVLGRQLIISDFKDCPINYDPKRVAPLWALATGQKITKMPASAAQVKLVDYVVQAAGILKSPIASTT
jgi:hypothetical protein